MIVEVLVISLIVVKIRGGKILNIENSSFKYWYLLVIGYFIGQAPKFLFKIGKDPADELNYILVLVSYVLISVVLFFNLRIKGVYYTFIGTIFNGVAILSNNAMMPVSKNAIIICGHDKAVQMGQSLDPMHFVSDLDTKMKMFSDFIPLPKPYLIPQILSIGDLLLALGLFILIQTIMVKKGSVPQTML